MSDRPKIVAERKRRAREMKPPQDFLIHEWGKPYAGIEVYISQLAFDKMMKQCATFAKRHLEALGYLVGDYCRWKNKEYTIVEDAVTSDLETTSVSVHFQGHEKAFDQLDKIDFDYVIVGWYHSHPGHGCFMSQTDISTQKRMFNKSFHIAIVVDPINKEFKVYKMDGPVPEEKVFGIYRNLNGEGPTTVEVRGPVGEEYAAYGDATSAPFYVPGSGQQSPAARAKAAAKAEQERLAREREAYRRARERAAEKSRLFSTALLLLPLFFAGFGGALGFALTFQRDRVAAWVILAVGAVMTLLWALLGPPILG
jgi:26S proteasome regulatory subunit N11